MTSLASKKTEDLRRRVSALRWFHQIDFGNGIVSPGVAGIDYLKAQADIYFGSGIAGKSVLDIGCWDGFNSVEAVRRGARRVLATDHWVWANIPGVSRETIELAREQLAPRLEIMEIDVWDLTPQRVGKFDVVLFCGVLYHVRHPLMALERVAELATETLIVETAMDAANEPRPAMIFYPNDELNGDPTNWWGPNRACVEAMLHDVGFSNVTYTPHPLGPTRGIFHAQRTQGHLQDARIARLQNEVAALSAACESARSRVAALESSRSWRMTAPLRGVSEFLRGARRRS